MEDPSGQRPAVDLSDAEVVDNHVHAFRLQDVLSRPAGDFETRMTAMGTCFLSSAVTGDQDWGTVRDLTNSTVFSLAARRWLSDRLGCAPGELAEARDRALRADPPGYVKGLVADSNIAGLIADEGYPQPPIAAVDFAAVTGVPVHRVARIEPWIAEILPEAERFGHLEDEFETRLDGAAADSGTVAYKSIIAYRTGLDVETVSAADAAAAFDHWRRDGFAETRRHAKPVRDFLLARTAAAAKRHDLALHIHCGDGDPDVVFGHARPQDLFRFLCETSGQPVVLIHAGHPWSEEAGYIASILPHVFVDLSMLVPWSSSALEHVLGRLIGMVPAAKLLYGSDEASEPEVLWVAARMARRALERTLAEAVDRDYLTRSEAQDIGRNILGHNTLRLHGLPGGGR